MKKSTTLGRLRLQPEVVRTLAAPRLGLVRGGGTLATTADPSVALADCVAGGSGRPGCLVTF
jgi:hypothetical protein